MDGSGKPPSAKGARHQDHHRQGHTRIDPRAEAQGRGAQGQAAVS